MGARMTYAADLLAGCRIALAGVGDPVASTLRELGAELATLEDPAADDDALREWCAAHGPLHGVVVDARDGRDATGPPGGARLTAALEHVWQAVRAVGVHALIAGGEGGRIVLIGPPPGAGPLAAAVTAGLESLARTLSVEWARFAITAVCVAPGDRTDDEEIAQLSAFVLSSAGGYLSGCRFSLGLVDATDAPAERRPLHPA